MKRKLTVAFICILLKSQHPLFPMDTTQRNELVQKLPIAALPFTPQGNEQLTAAFLAQRLPWFVQLQQVTDGTKRNEIVENVRLLYCRDSRSSNASGLATSRILVAALALACMESFKSSYPMILPEAVKQADASLTGLLLQQGADPNEVSQPLIPTICYWANKGCGGYNPRQGYALMELLLKHRANPNTFYDFGYRKRTGLMNILKNNTSNRWFTSENREWAKKAVALLLEHGAQVHLLDIPNPQKEVPTRNALDYARARTDCGDIVTMLEQKHAEDCKKFLASDSK